MPLEADITLNETVTYFNTTPSNTTPTGRKAYGIEYQSGVDGETYAEVYLDEDYLKALDIDPSSAGQESVLQSMLDTSATFTPSGLENNSPLTKILPDGALEGVASSGVQIAVFGGFGPVTKVGEFREVSTPTVAGGTQFSDVLTANGKVIDPTKIKDPDNAKFLSDQDSELVGFAGGDLLLGAAKGRDDIYGGEGDDVIYGFATSESNEETLDGGADDDVIHTGGSVAAIDGGSGTDTLSFALSDEAVTVTMADGKAFDGKGSAAKPNYSIEGVENIIGSLAADTMTGDGLDNMIEGGPAADAMDGAGGINTVSYQGSGAAVEVDLIAGTAEGGDADGDTFSNFDGLLGSLNDDTLIGASAPTRHIHLDGSDGDDVIMTGGTHATIEGGMGTDTLDFERSGSAIWLDQKTGRAFDTLGTETDPNYDFQSIEQVKGSSFDDVLILNVDNDSLTPIWNGHGGDGDDTLQFESGYYLFGGPGADTFTPLALNFFRGGSSWIQDFNHSEGDKIDLRALDAASTDPLDIRPLRPDDPNILAVTVTVAAEPATFIVQDDGAPLALTKADFIFIDTTDFGTPSGFGVREQDDTPAPSLAHDTDERGFESDLLL